jgi:catalase
MDVSHLTCADFLRSPGVQTPVIVRFRVGGGVVV